MAVSRCDALGKCVAPGKNEQSRRWKEQRMFEAIELVLTLILGLIWLISKIATKEKQDRPSDQDAGAAAALAPVATSYGDCRACGKPNPPDSAFCGECGASLEPAGA